MQVLDLEEIKKEFSFLYEDLENKKDIYFCSCGATTESENVDGQSHTASLSSEEIDYLYPKKEKNGDDDELSSVFKAIKMAESEDGVICSGCNKNFATLENEKKLVANNSIFISGYNILEDDDNLFLYYSQLNPSITKEDEKYNLGFEEKIKYIKYNKKENKTFFKDLNSNEFEFELNDIIKITDNIFSEEVKNIYNLYYVQIYISKLAKYVIDVNNTNITEELLSEAQNRENYAGLESIKKIISIFLAIIKYSNLSTIATTKGCKFLYDLMKECDIPKSEDLINNNLTAPIPIFNFLVSKYIKKINEEVNEDNKEAHEFIFKSSKIIKMEFEEEKTKVKTEEVKSFEVIDTGEEKELKIAFKNNKDYKTKAIHDSGKNKFQAFEISADANASKFIYKIIDNFSDYKQLLKYFKFYDKHQIITLLQKYEMELLTRVIDLIYFRDKVDIKEFEMIITIIKDFVTIKTLESKPALNVKDLKLEYSYVTQFKNSFTFYDDCIMMMEVLGFDPRREFNKIKTYKKLLEYHDNLVKYFSVVASKEKNASFKEFVARFNFLESREDYDGPIELKLISTPGMLITEGVQMAHSASSYSKRVISGSYLIGQVFDRTPNILKEELIRFTIGFTFDSVNGLEFDQVKGFANKPGTDRFKKLLMEFLTAKDISFRPIKDLKLLKQEE